MSRFLIFNHHSLPYESKSVACSEIPLFLKMCIRLQSIGLSTILVDETIDKNWFRLKLSNGFYWQDWYNKYKNSGHIDLVRAFRSISTRQPFFPLRDIMDDQDLFEVIFNNNISFSALHAAVWYEEPVASFPTRDPWNKSPIDVIVNRLSTDSHLMSTTFSIINFHSISVVDSMTAEITQRRNLDIQSGKEILEKRKLLYASIEVCGKAEQQLAEWSFSHTILDQVKATLSALNSFSEKWQHHQIDKYSDDGLFALGLGHPVSGESANVIQDPSLRKEREFWLPEGRKVLFVKHVKIAKGFRIHFFPDTDTRKIYVGYIGPHLKLR